MKQAELAHYRAILQAQAVEPPRRGIFAPRTTMAVVMATAQPGTITGMSGPPPHRAGSLFGRRPSDAAPAHPPEQSADLAGPLMLGAPAEAAPRLRLKPPESQHISETPFHAEDLADPPSPSGPTPGLIAGWSSAKPPSAQTRLLRRLGAVIEAERHGLTARLEAVDLRAAA